MLAVLMAGLLAQDAAPRSDLRREAPVLMSEATTLIIDRSGDLAETLGRCASVYPGGSANPFVVRARNEVADLGIEDLTFAVRHVESVLFAQAAAEPRDPARTVRACAAEIEEAAEDVRAYAVGLRALLVTLARLEQ